jgi:hypothetical protein
VAVVDNNDNLIVEFGKYGNMDSRGAGSAIPTPDIPLAYPVGAAASDNYIYVTDMGNARLARVKMEYALENMRLPEATVDRSAVRPIAARLIAAPNPFNPAVVLTLSGTLARGSSVKVFSMSGKLIADLSRNISNGRVVWNASGISSGVYMAVAQKGALRLTKKIVYSK